MSVDKIATTLNISIWTVRKALMTDEERQKKAISDRARMSEKLRRMKKQDRGPRIDTMAICRRFASGEIDRAELSRQLRGA